MRCPKFRREVNASTTIGCCKMWNVHNVQTADIWSYIENSLLQITSFNFHTIMYLIALLLLQSRRQKYFILLDNLLLITNNFIIHISIIIRLLKLRRHDFDWVHISTLCIFVHVYNKHGWS